MIIIKVNTNLSKCIFDTREEAIAAKDKLEEVILKLGHATFADLINICGYEGFYKDTKRGWKSMFEFKIDKCDHGYKLILPKYNWFDKNVNKPTVKICKNCKYYGKSMAEIPCSGCTNNFTNDFNNCWEPKEATECLSTL